MNYLPAGRLNLFIKSSLLLGRIELQILNNNNDKENSYNSIITCFFAEQQLLHLDKLVLNFPFAVSMAEMNTLTGNFAKNISAANSENFNFYQILQNCLLESASALSFFAPSPRSLTLLFIAISLARFFSKFIFFLPFFFGSILFIFEKIEKKTKFWRWNERLLPETVFLCTLEILSPFFLISPAVNRKMD